MPGPRDYKPTTIRRLDTLSGNQCAAPDCIKPLIAKDGQTIISKICHIEAADVNGQRYNPQMTDDDRRHYNNLILLCDECHNIVDNPANINIYTVSVLLKWKKDHESKMLFKLASNPSLLKNAINAISQLDFNDDDSISLGTLVPFAIEDKIKFNSIKRNKTLIEEYKIFYTKINNLYEELENDGSFKKDKLLRYIKQIYLEVKGKYIGDSNNPVEIIQNNSDNIIEDIQEILFNALSKEKDLTSEDIEFGISIIMVDSFMRCKILEEPK
jgi:hypothetical protein